jgi:N-[(2S)-2-amino-2-carboxyethyl]-L-glutamate dehydrogenase
MSMAGSDLPVGAPPRYLNRTDVVAACRTLDPVAVVRQALRLHAQGSSTLPDEAYLPWTTAGGAAARSLALPGALWGEPPALGLKVINSSLSNTGSGLPRAQGYTFLFHPETAQVEALMEGAYISALRTAAYTALSVDLLAAVTDIVAVIGCGVIGRAHIGLLAERLPETRFAVYDTVADLRDRVAAGLRAAGTPVTAAASAEDAVRHAGVVVTATTTTAGYLRYAWLRPGALVAHVSLDDVVPEVVERADLVIVDDWQLVAGDRRRLLGRMHHAGQLAGPAGEECAGAVRRVDATLDDVLTGRHPGRAGDEQIVLSNPFGMGILDVALAAEVWRVARERGLGMSLPP